MFALPYSGSPLACPRSTEMEKLGNLELAKEEDHSTSENFARKWFWKSDLY